MDPLKTFAATLFCLALFWLVLRLTRRLMDMAITAGHAETRRREEAEAIGQAGAMPLEARGVPPTAPHAVGAVP